MLTELGETYKENCNQPQELTRLSGILATLVHVFKTGHRDDLMPRVDSVFTNVLKSQINDKFCAKSSVSKKARVNLAHRIGCIFLKPRVAKWRYQRGSRSLAANLASSGILASAPKEGGQ